MKIGITCQPSAGGSGIMATELGIALAERGHTVHFVTHEQPFRLKGFIENVYCHTVEMTTYPLFRTSMATMLANPMAVTRPANSQKRMLGPTTR